GFLRPASCDPFLLRPLPASLLRRPTLGGGGWIRTNVGVSQQIYSLPPLATRAPLQGTANYGPRGNHCQPRGGVSSGPAEGCRNPVGRPSTRGGACGIGRHRPAG